MAQAQTLPARQHTHIADSAEAAADALARLLRRASANTNAGVSVMQAPTVLIVPGLNGSGPGHWQSAWERERGDCRRADLGQWHDPEPARWVARLDAAVRAIGGPVVLAAHSLGCITTALWAKNRPADRQVLGALLVAPCDPEAADACQRLRRFAPIPLAPLAFPSAVIASTNDPYATAARSRDLADAWGAAFVNAGPLGHINASSNLGAWTDGQRVLHKFLQPQS